MKQKGTAPHRTRRKPAFHPLLDARSECTPHLARLAASGINQLALLPGIRAARISSEISSSKPGSSPPTGHVFGPTPAERRDQFNRALTHRQRLEVIQQINRQIAQARGGTELSERRGTVEWKLAIATDDRTSALVAVDYGISASRVRQLRSEMIRGELTKRKR